MPNKTLDTSDSPLDSVTGLDRAPEQTELAP
jgi:hypothetical protein